VREEDKGVLFNRYRSNSSRLAAWKATKIRAEGPKFRNTPLLAAEIGILRILDFIV
jgi:hypothetical protein